MMLRIYLNSKFADWKVSSSIWFMPPMSKPVDGFMRRHERLLSINLCRACWYDRLSGQRAAMSGGMKPSQSK
jgi:hypothetical protein